MKTDRVAVKLQRCAGRQMPTSPTRDFVAEGVETTVVVVGRAVLPVRRDVDEVCAGNEVEAVEGERDLGFAFEVVGA